MVKLVTIDLDGTLFDKNKNISAENKKAIRLAKENGCKIVISTGRPISGVMPVLEALDLTTEADYAIIYNGSKIFNVGTKETIFSQTISGKIVKELFKESLRLGVFFHAFRKNEQLITSIHNPYTDVEAGLNHIEDVITDIDAIEDNEEFLKAMLVDCSEKLDFAAKNIKSIYYNNFSMVRSADIFLEFLNKKADKGLALEALANYLNIDLKDTMALGDAGNDISMIKKAGYGVAMANSFPEVLGIAKYVTDTNENDGVAKAIYKFVLNK